MADSKTDTAEQSGPKHNAAGVTSKTVADILQLLSQAVPPRTVPLPLKWKPKDIRPQDVSSYSKLTDILGRTPQLSSDMQRLQQEIIELRGQVTEKAKAVLQEKNTIQQQQTTISELQDSYALLEAKQSLAHLLHRIRPSAQERVLRDPTFLKRFRSGNPSKAFVVAIDLRRSTELMLKARQPRLFAEFIISLADRLRRVVLDNYGVFDKFTGDGILAFFPDFYSGQDAGYRAASVAEHCHRIFQEHYNAHRSSFTSVLINVGLGIGIDYGQVQIVEIGGDFTVVGTPVVYACRMASANAGQTLINQPAHERLFGEYSTFDFNEASLDIKHEGQTLAYELRSNGKSFVPATPDWENEGSAQTRKHKSKR